MRDRYVISEQMVEARRKALVALQQTEDKNQIGIGYLALGIILLWAGHLDEAEEQLGKALALAETVGIAWLQIRSLTFLPFVFRKRGEVEEVRRLLVHAQDVGATRNNSVITGHSAWVAWRDGNLSEAEAYARKSIEERQPQQMEVDPFQWAGLWPLFGVALAQEEMVTAMNTIRMLLSPTQQPPPEQLQTLLEGALQAWEMGKQEEAQLLLQQAVPLAKQGGYL
jgi:tetratricopeptide (TPR) repeat protein